VEKNAPYLTYNIHISVVTGKKKCNANCSGIRKSIAICVAVPEKRNNVSH
jgi:hypothetical protein